MAPLIVFDRTGSTSTVLAAWAAREARLPEGTTIVARAQSAARGSRGRGWVSPAGNFAASILRRPACARDAGRLALVTAVALADILPAVPGLRLKWPNDLMVGDAKLAGILIEVFTGGPGAQAVVGVGVNTVHAPVVAGRRTVSLAALGIAAPDPVALAAALRDALACAPGFAAVAAAWLARADPIGTPVTVLAQGVSRRGAFAGLSPEGHLLLAGPDGVRAIAAGEVADVTRG